MKKRKNYGNIISFLLIVSLIVGLAQINFVTAQGVLWESPVEGTNVVYLKAIPDVTGDGHEDVFIVTSSDNNGWLYIINGRTGNVAVGGTALGFLPTEAIYLYSSQRIVVAYAEGVRVYSTALNQISSFKITNQPTDLQTFSGNEIVFYNGTIGGSWTISCYSLLTGSQIWTQQLVSDWLATRTMKDIMVMNEDKLLVSHTYDALIGDSYYTWFLNSAGSKTFDSAISGYNIYSDELRYGYYNSTHFLNNVQKPTERKLNFDLATDSTSIVWSIPVWNAADNLGFPVVDINNDGTTDIAVILGGNLAVVNGKNGATIRTFGTIFSDKIDSVAVVNDVNGDGVKEVVIRAGQTYLVSLAGESNNIIWQNDLGAYGLEAIQDVNGDGASDVILADSGIITCITGTTIQKVTAPTFSPSEGTYTNAQSIEISCATPDAIIKYTTNGENPTHTTGTVYSGAFSIDSSTTIKAFAYKAGMIDSDITTITYTINIPSTPTPTPTSAPPTSTPKPTPNPTQNPTIAPTPTPTTDPTVTPTPTQTTQSESDFPINYIYIIVVAFVVVIAILAILLIRKQKKP